MTIGILGKKIGMTRIYNEKGEIVPVTVIEAGPCPVVQIKTAKKEGYNAIQLGYGTRKPKHSNNPLTGHFQKNNISPCRLLKEFRLDGVEINYKVGDQITVDIFKEGELIDIRGKSKGRGFAGSIKRNNFSRGPMSHGSCYHRRTGSQGASAYPSRVFKNMPSPGHMGNVQVCIQSLSIIKVDKEKNLLLIRGGIPGANNGYLMITKAIKSTKKK